MPLSHLFADSLFVRLFTGGARRAALVVSMTGVKLGERLLVVGLSDPALLAALGGKVGLTGRACGVDASDTTVDRARRAVERAGVLAEFETVPFARLPYEAASFDVAVVRSRGPLADEGTLTSALEAVASALRDGGRCEVIADAKSRGLGGARLTGILGAVGYRGPRVLAEREGLVFVEAVKRGAPQNLTPSVK